MKNRCYGAKTIQPHLYKDKGIDVCAEWHSFKLFRMWAEENGYKDGLQIDRKDNSKGYYPDNCRFATPLENCNNRGITFKVMYKGELRPLKMLLRDIGVDSFYYTIRTRIIRGWDVYRAIHTPPKKGNYNYGNRWKVVESL
jgi:hypothetical protein